MKYSNIVKGKFLSRPNRFIAIVEINEKEYSVHVKNTGRCKELLIPGATVYLEKAENPERKTPYDLVTVEKVRENKNTLKINMDSLAANVLAYEFLCKNTLFSEKAIIKREVTHGDSRFDFFIEDGNRKAFLEVKGVTLEHNGIASFPDAPTERGIKHINGLEKCIAEGFEAYILFVVQMNEIHHVIPNDATHKAFGDALRKASSNGVKVLAIDCMVTANEVLPDKLIPVIL